MPQVPYNPVPTGQPIAGTGSRGLSVNAPEGAFGGGVANAIKDLGGVESHVGDELFQRALALKQLQNETEAKQADADYMIKAGKLHADYGALEGQNAVKAFPQHQQDLEDLRKQTRDGLSNDAARKMFDSSSLSVMSRTIFNAAGHAATENKKWALHGSEARVEGWKDQTASTPNDDIAFQRSINGLKAEVDSQADLQGWGQDQRDHKFTHDQSGLWSHRIVGLARTSPFQAKNMLEQNRDKILGQDQEKVEQVVRQALHTTGSRVLSDNVNSGWAAYMKPGDIDRSVGVEESLTRIVKEAQRANPDIRFTIGGQGGRRNQAQQDELVRQGVSQTHSSDHLDGRAIDLVPLNDKGQPDYNDRAGYAKIAPAMAAAAERLGIPLAEKSEKFKSWDPGHFSLPKDFNVAQAPKAVEEPLQSRIDRGVVAAKALSPEDTDFADAVRNRIESDFTRTKAIKRDFEYTNRNTVEGALVGGVGNGKIPTTVEELRATDPKVAQAFDNLDEIHQRTYIKALATNAKGDMAWNSQSLQRYQVLKGMAHDSPEEFLGTDVISEKMPNRAKLEMINLQQKLQANAESDPRTTRALGILQADMFHAGITKAQDKDRYYGFVGALQDQIRDFQEAHKKPPNAEEVQKIGSQLMQEQHTRFWQSSQRMFEGPPPNEVAEQIKSDPAWAKLGITPTDEQVQRVWARSQFQKLYGGSAKSADKPKPGIPQSK